MSTPLSSEAESHLNYLSSFSGEHYLLKGSRDGPKSACGTERVSTFRGMRHISFCFLSSRSLDPYQERLGFLAGGPRNRIAVKSDLLPVVLQTALQLAVGF